MGEGRVVMGLLFYPRGGSAYVVRYLSPALERAGWTVGLATGSLGVAGDETHAATFFSGLDVHVVDATDAVRAFEAGGDAIAAPQPMHPSYEDRVGVADAVFASVAPELAAHLAAAWREPLRAAGADDADVLHLHHLTPQLDAAERGWPDVPKVVHLHGTELLMVQAAQERAAVAALLGETLATMPSAAGPIISTDGDAGLDPGSREVLRTTRWESWRHGAFWVERMKEQAQLADHIVTVSPQNRATAVRVLGVAPTDVTPIANGVDLERFHPRPDRRRHRRDLLRWWLVDDPQGWSETTPAGSLAYSEEDLDRMHGPDERATILLCVGRFTTAKRVPTLIRAFARARSRFEHPASLLIWGGHPGEWEGEHPVTVAETVGAEGIFFTGWRGHDDLPDGLAAADVLVMASVDDAYPQTPLEAMASGLPVLACRSGGLPEIVDADSPRPTGWLVAPDDVDALAAGIAHVVNQPAETAARGANAAAHARAELSWDGLVPRFEAAYHLAIERHHRREPARQGEA
jgi:glycosyltransferase involved in cell wall biosynthesis